MQKGLIRKPPSSLGKVRTVLSSAGTSTPKYNFSGGNYAVLCWFFESRETFLCVCVIKSKQEVWEL